VRDSEGCIYFSVNTRAATGMRGAAFDLRNDHAFDERRVRDNNNATRPAGASAFPDESEEQH
jgi:hypothetical protein